MSRNIKFAPALMISLILTFLFGFTGQAQARAIFQAASPESSMPSSSPASSTAPVYEYRLGSGDKLKINVYGEPDLTGEFTVSGDGRISFPLIGNVDALGQTETQLASKITVALQAGYLKDPKVNVEVLTFRPFFILGEVNKPGQYDFANGMTVERAVAVASGYTYRADKKKVFIKHVNDEKEVAVPMTSQVVVQPGDTIRIGERYF